MLEGRASLPGSAIAIFLPLPRMASVASRLRSVPSLFSATRSASRRDLLGISCACLGRFCSLPPPAPLSPGFWVRGGAPCSPFSVRPSFCTLESAFLKKAEVSRARVSLSTRLSRSERYLVGFSGARSSCGVPSETTWPDSFCSSSGGFAGGSFGSSASCCAELVLGPKGPLRVASAECGVARSETACRAMCLGMWKTASCAMNGRIAACANTEMATAAASRLRRRAGF